MPSLDSFKIGDECRIRGHDGWKGRIVVIDSSYITINWYQGGADPNSKSYYEFNDSSFVGDNPYFYKLVIPKIPKTKAFSLSRK